MANENKPKITAIIIIIAGTLLLIISTHYATLKPDDSGASTTAPTGVTPKLCNDSLSCTGGPLGELVSTVQRATIPGFVSTTATLCIKRGESISSSSHVEERLSGVKASFVCEDCQPIELHGENLTCSMDQCQFKIRAECSDYVANTSQSCILTVIDTCGRNR